MGRCCAKRVSVSAGEAFRVRAFVSSVLSLYLSNVLTLADQVTLRVLGTGHTVGATVAGGLFQTAKGSAVRPTTGALPRAAHLSGNEDASASQSRGVPHGEVRWACCQEQHHERVCHPWKGPPWTKPIETQHSTSQPSPVHHHTPHLESREHAIFLGGVSSFCRLSLWFLLLCGAWGPHVHTRGEQVVQHNITECYKRRHLTDATERLARARLTRNKVGSASDPQLKTKGADTCLQK